MEAAVRSRLAALGILSPLSTAKGELGGVARLLGRYGLLWWDGFEGDLGQEDALDL
jgi:hypothetical protein